MSSQWVNFCVIQDLPISSLIRFIYYFQESKIFWLYNWPLYIIDKAACYLSRAYQSSLTTYVNEKKSYKLFIFFQTPNFSPVIIIWLINVFIKLNQISRYSIPCNCVLGSFRVLILTFLVIKFNVTWSWCQEPYL